MRSCEELRQADSSVQEYLDRLGVHGCTKSEWRGSELLSPTLHFVVRASALVERGFGEIRRIHENRLSGTAMRVFASAKLLARYEFGYRR